jgi:glycosyltransferase involved in cell wall biosynthesis
MNAWEKGFEQNHLEMDTQRRSVMRLTVCMATYNGSEYVKLQLGSILKQLGPEDQVVVVDDASNDNTVEIINSFNDPRIYLSINDFNIGPARTFDRALHQAQGDLIFLSDQDDFWHDGKVATVVRMFETANIDLLVHDAVVVRDGQVVHASLFAMGGSSAGIIKNILSNTFTGCCMAFRRDVLCDVLPISAQIGLFHDAWIGVLAQYFGYKITFVPMPLIDFIRHADNASTLQRRGIITIISDRTNFIIALFLQIFRVYLKRMTS